MSYRYGYARGSGTKHAAPPDKVTIGKPPRTVNRGRVALTVCERTALPPANRCRRQATRHIPDPKSNDRLLNIAN